MCYYNIFVPFEALNSLCQHFNPIIASIIIESKKFCGLWRFPIDWYEVSVTLYLSSTNIATITYTCRRFPRIIIIIGFIFRGCLICLFWRSYRFIIVSWRFVNNTRSFFSFLCLLRCRIQTFFATALWGRWRCSSIFCCCEFNRSLVTETVRIVSLLTEGELANAQTTLDDWVGWEGTAGISLLPRYQKLTLLRDDCWTGHGTLNCA